MRNQSRDWILLGRSVLGDSFSPLGNGVLGQLSGEEKSDGSLDLPGCDGAPLVVVGQARGFSSNPFEDVVDKAVHDGHSLPGNPGVGMDLLEDLIDVDPVALLPSSLLPLVPLGDVLLGFPGFLGSFSRRFRSHD